MSVRSDSLDDDNQSRKRHLTEEIESTSPAKRPKSSSAIGFLLTPLTSLFGMFGAKKPSKPSGLQVSAEADTDDDVVHVVTTPKKQEKSGEIIFLNSSNAPNPHVNSRLEAGNEEDDVVVIPKTSEIADEDDIVVEKYIQRTLEISDDNDQDDDVQEIQSIQKSPENRPQTDEDLTVQFVKIVKTPNRDLQNARKFQNEIIFLNGGPAEDPEEEDLREPFDSTNPSAFASPTPDESASRPWTPNDTFSFSSPYSSSNNIRDYWRRSTAKRNGANSTLSRRAPHRPIQRIATSTIQKHQKTSKKQQQAARDSLNKYKEQLIACGYITADTNFDIEEKRKKKTTTLSASDLIARAKSTMAGIEAESRSGTPSVFSRDSSIASDGPERTPAGSGRDTSSEHPSTSSDRPTTSSVRTPSSSQLTEMLSRIETLDISTLSTDKTRYQSIYEQNRRKEEDLLEELRIRDAHRAQTKEERREEIRKQLAMKGIVIKPKPKKVVKEEFMQLPTAADGFVEKAWNKALSKEELFIDAFGIKIQRQDLLTLAGLNWLNDNIITFYLQLICQRSQSEENYPKVYAFNTFFYTNIVSKGYASVKRWTRKTDIFSYDILLVPVHLGMHWCMAVIDVAEKRVDFYDSLYNGNTVVLPAIRGYLEAESLDKKKTALDLSGWKMQQLNDIPRQQNGSDCGVFSCQFGEWAARRKRPGFEQKHMPYYRKRMVHEICTQKLLATI